MSIVRFAAVVAGSALLLAGSLAAQSPALDQVEQLARLGRTEEARLVLLEWWNGDRGDSEARDLQRGLWLRGRLTVDPVQAELDFQRLVVLYPSGPYTPQALLRLAQSAHSQGDADGARQHVATLVRDYPASTSRDEAEAWIQNAGPAPPRSEATPARRDAAPQTTVRVADPGVASTRDDPRPSAIEEEDEVLDWMVQFGAFAEEDRALGLHEELLNAGLDARLVRVDGSGFLHVRIGRFSNRIDANSRLEEVTAQGFTAAIVRDDRAEEVVGR